MDLSDSLHPLLADGQVSDDSTKGQRIVQNLDTAIDTHPMCMA